MYPTEKLGLLPARALAGKVQQGNGTLRAQENSCSSPTPSPDHRAKLDFSCSTGEEKFWGGAGHACMGAGLFSSNPDTED